MDPLPPPQRCRRCTEKKASFPRCWPTLNFTAGSLARCVINSGNPVWKSQVGCILWPQHLVFNPKVFSKIIMKKVGMHSKASNKVFAYNLWAIFGLRTFRISLRTNAFLVLNNSRPFPPSARVEELFHADKELPSLKTRTHDIRTPPNISVQFCFWQNCEFFPLQLKSENFDKNGGGRLFPARPWSY